MDNKKMVRWSDTSSVVLGATLTRDLLHKPDQNLTHPSQWRGIFKA